MKRLLPALLLGLFVPALALGQDDETERRLKDLEDRLGEMQERLDEAERELERHDRVLGLPPSGAVDPFTLVPARAPAEPSGLEIPESFSGDGGLAWLKKHQEPDGHWAAPKDEHDVAVTSLALLAFCGSGHTHRFGIHKRTVNKAASWLKKRQAGSGYFKSAAKLSASTLDQALGTFALCELYAISRDFTLKRPAEAAAGALLLLQTESGGWSFGGPRSPANSLATIYAVLGLKAAKTAGLTVPTEAFERAATFLASVTDAQGLVGLYKVGDGVSVTVGELRPTTPSAPLFTAGSVIARIFCGERRSVDALQAGIDRFTPLDAIYEPVYAYFATYALFQVGGDSWKAWNTPMQAALLSSQVVGAGEDQGSWDPVGIWGALGGRAAVTAHNMLTLEVYYRYARAQESEKRD